MADHLNSKGNRSGWNIEKKSSTRGGMKTKTASETPADSEVSWAYTKQVKQDGAVTNPLAPPVGANGGPDGSGYDRGSVNTMQHLENDQTFDWGEFEEIKQYGYMFKEKKEDIRLIGAAAWRRRFFVLWTPKPPYDRKNSMIMYFEDEISCQKYFKNVNLAGVMTNLGGGGGGSGGPNVGSKTKAKQNVDDLLLGSIDLASLTYFQESYRLDLKHRAMELKTPRRTWVLQVEGVENFYNWFHAIWKALVSCNNRSVKMQLPNVWNYRMPGKYQYRIFFFIFMAAGVWWLYNLLVAGSPDLQPCVEDTVFLRKAFTCQEISLYGAKIGYAYDIRKCETRTVEDFWWYGAWNPFVPQGDQQWKCFVDINKYYPSKPPMYWLFVIAEFLNLIFAGMFYLGLWRPTRRGARFLDNLNPPFPSRYWPEVDVFICHYSEPAEDTMETVEAAMNMEYPKDKLHVWVCDDGYCRSDFNEERKWPKVTPNHKLIGETGDVREQLAELVRDKVGNNDDSEAKIWRKQHSQTIQPEPDGDQVVPRRDCAVGMVRDDYVQYTDKICSIHYVARMKPKTHHSKAGNINNALYNAGSTGRYLLILDNDMKPHPKFLKATLPLFYCKPGRLGGSIFDDSFTTENMDASEVVETKIEPLDTPVTLPTVSPAYGADMGADRSNKDLLTLDEQIKLRDTCRRQAQEIRDLKKKMYESNTLGQYRPYKKNTGKREKKIFEASAPEDLEGARISMAGKEDADDDPSTGEDGEWM